MKWRFSISLEAVCYLDQSPKRFEASRVGCVIQKSEQETQEKAGLDLREVQDKVFHFEKANHFPFREAVLKSLTCRDGGKAAIAEASSLGLSTPNDGMVLPQG